jgi:hypothetical protein
MFCEEELGFSKCHRILDGRLINFAQQTVMQLNDPSLRRFPSFRFPGGLPVTVEARHINSIKMGNYMFSAKADGFRVLIVFFIYYIDGDWQRLCVIISRDGSCHLLTLQIPTELYDNGGSLFDGELVSTTSGWNHILLFDCYSYKGINIRQLPLKRRFARCEKLAEQTMHREVDSVIIKAKPYYSLIKQHLDDALAFLGNVNHYLDFNTDGIVLVPPGPSLCTQGRDETQFKMKSNHTIDLILIQDTDDAEQPFFLASYDDSDDSYIPKQQVNIEEIGNPPVNSIFECEIVTIEGINTFTPTKLRPDKMQANSEMVIKRTLSTISDNIQVAKLMVH